TEYGTCSGVRGRFRSSASLGRPTRRRWCARLRFDVCPWSQLFTSATRHEITGLQRAEYLDEVWRRAASLHGNLLDVAVSDSDDERPIGRLHDGRSRHP